VALETAVTIPCWTAPPLSLLSSSALKLTIGYSRLILQTPSGDAEEIRCAAIEHCLQYNLFLRDGRNPTSDPEPLGYGGATNQTYQLH
jgi:hypothetical protein